MANANTADKKKKSIVPAASASVPATTKNAKVSQNKRGDNDTITKMISDVSWVDRVAKEMRAQREWSEKWGALNDPKLYLGETGPVSFKAQKIPTKWSAFSIINPPNRNPLSSRPSTPDIDTSNPYISGTAFKVTGNRDTFLSSQKSARGRRPLSPDASMEWGSYHHPSSPSDPISQYSVYESAPFAVSVSSSPKRNVNRASLASYNAVNSRGISISGNSGRPAASSHGISSEKSIGVVDEACTPMGKYKFPPTTSMEYGWHWKAGKNASLERFGATSADFSRESWKRSAN